MDWCRVEFEQSVYEPAKRQFVWSSGEMQVMYRVLDWAEKCNVDVFNADAGRRGMELVPRKTLAIRCAY